MENVSEIILGIPGFSYMFVCSIDSEISFCVKTYPVIVWVVGYGLVVSMDDRGGILIPKDIRRKVKTKLFTIELMDDGTIMLKPIASEVLKLASRFKGLLKFYTPGKLGDKSPQLLGYGSIFPL